MQDLEKKIADLEKQVAELKASAEARSGEETTDRLTMLLFSGDLDKAIATFIIANGAAASDMEVDIFVTFWGISVFRDPKKHVKKNLISTMFGWMMPKGSNKLKLSQMEMAGMGSKMIRGLMKQKNVMSLEKLIETAGELGVRIHICTMSMDLMGFKEEEFINYPNLNFAGVGTYVGLAADSKFTSVF